jgi:hypothetical protein
MRPGKMSRTMHALWGSIRALAGKVASRGLPSVMDGVYKLAIPIGTIILAYVGHNIQQSVATTQMLVQREQADTQIRAEMFKATTDQLFKGGKDQPLTPSEQAVFAELLTLNFHEHIELKPLLLDVDEKLAAEYAAVQEKLKRQPGNAREQTAMLQINSRQLDDRLGDLRSVARRVRSRQTAMLVGEPSAPGSGSQAKRAWWNFLSPAHAGTVANESQGTIRYVGVRRQSVCESKDTYLDRCGVRPDEGKNVCTEELLRETSPDGKSFVSLSMREKTSDFRRQRFDVGFKDQTLPALHVEPSGEEAVAGRTSNAPTGATMVDFRVTWFDFPLTDNTLLASGARFAIFLDRVCEKSRDAEEVDAVRFGLLWFPQDYYPARERPTNYRQFREKLGLVMQNPR